MTPADLDLDHLEALDREATPAPWHILDIPWRDPRVPGEVVLAGDEDPHVGVPVVETVVLDGDHPDRDRWHDARLIAATRNALPHLIAEARAAEGVRDALGHGADEEAWPPGMTLGEAVAELRLVLAERTRQMLRLREALARLVAVWEDPEGLIDPEETHPVDVAEAALADTMEAARAAMQAVDGVER